jgi:Uma2 family endonuclease
MATDPHQRLTIPEYLAFERQSETRHDYLDGEVFAMTGASWTHGLISGNIFGELRSQLKRSPCKAIQESLRVRTPAGLFTYPDVIVACGKPRFDGSEQDTLLNPKLIVEVLSPSTEMYDRKTKAAHYRSIPSLSEYLLVAQSQIRIEQWSRDGREEWQQRDFTSLEQCLELRSIGCKLLLGDVYDEVFEET